MNNHPWAAPAKKNLEIQRGTMPRTEHLRIMLSAPTVEMLNLAYLKLREAGAPDNAEIHFKQWNAPQNNYYIEAIWNGD